MSELQAADPYQKQKEAHGKWATFAWIGSGLYLFLTADGVSIWSWQALVFFLVGMFAAAIIFGIAAYGVQRGIAKILAKGITRPTASLAKIVSMIGISLFVVETVVIFLVAQWMFHQIV